jgi:hypothetical protein
LFGKKQTGDAFCHNQSQNNMIRNKLNNFTMVCLIFVQISDLITKPFAPIGQSRADLLSTVANWRPATKRFTSTTKFAPIIRITKQQQPLYQLEKTNKECRDTFTLNEDECFNRHIK